MRTAKASVASPRPSPKEREEKVCLYFQVLSPDGYRDGEDLGEAKQVLLFLNLLK
jgi:hypothetical protein